MISGFNNLMSGLYPPDFLVGLACRLYGGKAPDARWEYVKGTRPDQWSYKKPCTCRQSMEGWSDAVPSPYPPGINIKPVVTLGRHFHSSQSVFFLGRCDFCGVIYWSCPRIKEDEKE